MKILHITTMDTGGAGRAACWLHRGLLRAGMESRVLCRDEAQCLEGVTRYLIPPWKRRLTMAWRCRSVLLKVVEIQHNTKPDYEIFTFPFSGYSIERHPLAEWADVIHLHWVADFLNYPTFFQCVKKPLVWTVRDMNPYMGGFHYADDAGRHPWPLERRFEALKIKIIRQVPNLSIVALSRQHEAFSAASEMFRGRPHRVIHNGVDLALFSPRPREAARARFGIPQDKRVLLFVAQTGGPGARRKGVDMLEQGVADFKAMGLHLCGIGAFKDNRVQSFPLMRQEDLPALYSAADFAVVPSREDAGPNTMMEPMACGTPVVGTPAGWMIDFIRKGETGVLAREVSAEAVREAVREAAEAHTFDRAKIRAFAEENFSLEKQARAYCEVYREAMERGAS